MGRHAARTGNSVPTFRDNLSVPSSRFKFGGMGPVGFPETSVLNHRSTLCNVPEERMFGRWMWFKCTTDACVPDGRVTRIENVLNWWNI